jgi:hypothetical protein
MTMNDWAALHRVVVDEDADEVASVRSAPSIRNDWFLLGAPGFIAHDLPVALPCGVVPTQF